PPPAGREIPRRLRNHAPRRERQDRAGLGGRIGLPVRATNLSPFLAISAGYGAISESSSVRRSRFSALLLQLLHKGREFSVGDRHEMLVLGESAFLDIGPELLECGDALVLQTVIFSAKVAIHFGVARL